MDNGIRNRNIKGDIIAPGIASGTLCFVDFNLNTTAIKNGIPKKEVAREATRFRREIESVSRELKQIRNVLKKDSLFEEADIVQAHILMLEDHGFQNKVLGEIKENKLAAEIALEHVLQEIVTVLRNSENSNFAQLADDLKDIGLRLGKRLRQEDTRIYKGILEGIKDPVVVISQLLPSAVLEGRMRGVRAFITQEGSSLSHAAILAKSFGLPVIKVKNQYELLYGENMEVTVDALNGKILINPDEEEIHAIISEAENKPVQGKLKLPARLWINIVDPSQVSWNELKDIEGVGLYRTEFLFIHNRTEFPGEEEQFSVYSDLFTKSGNSTVTIRTLDIGGDKTLSYFSFGLEENPYLGLRAHRIYRFHPELFMTQVKAILRAAYQKNNVRILYPMIESLDSLLTVQELLREAKQVLEHEGRKYSKNVMQGILIEVPSAVWDLRELLQHADFASLGTNDLFQYLFAVDRNNANVYDYYQPENPLVIRMLKQIVDTANEMRKPLSICGEIASDPHFLPILIGLGIEDLSVDINSIPVVKERLSGMNISDCRALVQKCLAASRTQEVKTVLDDFNFSNQRSGAAPFSETAELIDPVCGMTVTKNSRWKVISGGKTVYFCSKSCRDKYLKSGMGKEGDHGHRPGLRYGSR